MEPVEPRSEKGGSGDDGRFSIVNIEASDDSARPDQPAYIQVVATSPGCVTVMKLVSETAASDELLLETSNKVGTLSGVVTDVEGRPISGVTVYVPCCGVQCVLDCMAAVTDAQGRYAIHDLRRWKPSDTATFDPKTGLGTFVGSYALRLSHPDYALTSASCTSIPQEVNVTLIPPATIEGRVIDRVTGHPMPGVTVSAQGIAHYDFLQTQTDKSGRYRLRANEDRFNIWADADDRIAIAAKAVAARSGETTPGVDISLVRGGFVTGTVFDGQTGKPVVPDGERILRVAHYGPARPRTGPAVTSVPVRPDGTYRLRVAPGPNYVYLMNGGTSGHVEVADGQETQLDLRTGEQQNDNAIYDDPDFLLAERLRRRAREQDDQKARAARGELPPPKPPERRRPDTPTGRLLDKLADQNAGSARYQDAWLRTLKAIVDLGPEAVPELIAELDATSDEMMLRCCGFTLRAIGDRRAMPALIRAIPKTLVPASSDMGLLAEDEALAKWAQQYDVGEGGAMPIPTTLAGRCARFLPLSKISPDKR